MTNCYHNSFKNLSNLEGCHENPNIFDRNYPPLENQKGELPDTRLDEDESAPLKSRSNKTCAEPFESSFQINFTYEHIEAMKKKLQNFVESPFSITGKVSEVKAKSGIWLDESDADSFYFEIKEFQPERLSSTKWHQIIVDLKFERKLEEVLNKCCGFMSKAMLELLIEMADFILAQHSSLQDGQFTEEDLIRWAKSMKQSQKDQFEAHKQQFQALLPYESKAEDSFENEKVEGLIEFFYVTLTLVIEQYFENPEFKDESAELFKRGCSDDLYSSDQFSELQDFQSGKKKIKMDSFW